MRVIQTILNDIARVGAVAAAACVGVTAVAYVVEIVARYGLGSPLNWATDIGSYMLCAAVFLALPQIARNREHVAITLLTDSLPSKVRERYATFLSIVTAAVLFVVAWLFAEVSLTQLESGVLTPMANQIPRWWLTAIMAIGLFISGLHFLFPQAPGIPVVHSEV